MCDRPAWSRGADQRIELQTLGGRDLSRGAGAKLATERALAMAGLARAADVDVVELCATTPAEELILCEAMGLDAAGPRPASNPTGGPLGGHPVTVAGPIRPGGASPQLAGRADG